MTFENEPEPGEFPDISQPADYARLVALARRRLVGFEQHAEDVVSLALIKWARIPADRRGIARIEQVIKSEAYSFLRSERRARERDTRSVSDRSLAVGATSRAHTAQDAVELRQALAETIRSSGVTVTATDVEVFELLLSGLSPSDIVRRTSLTRHQVRKSRKLWQKLLRRTLAEPAPSRRSAPQV